MVNTENTGKTLKVIDINAKKFTANGKNFNIEMGGIAISRLIEYEKLQIELGYGLSFIQVYEGLKETYEMNNKRRDADVAVKLYNMMRGIKTFEDRRLPALELCTLFINTDNENRGVYTKEMVNEKISDWEAEGLDAVPFFQLAINSLQNFSQAYNEINQISSELEKHGSTKKK